MSSFNQSVLGLEESLGLLDGYLLVIKYFKLQVFTGDNAQTGFSKWLAVDALVNDAENSKKMPSLDTGWILEKTDLK